MPGYPGTAAAIPSGTGGMPGTAGCAGCCIAGAGAGCGAGAAGCGAGAAGCAGAGAGCGTGAADSWIESSCSSVWFSTREIIVFASSSGITQAKSVDIASWISSLNVTETISSPSFASMASRYASSESTIFASGVEMLIGMPRKSERAVADEPIIWFITSQAALMLSSSNSKSSEGGSSLPISRFRITCISFWRNTITFVPEMPSTYRIVTSMAGSIAMYSMQSNFFCITSGVEITTCLSSILETAVAAEPILIFRTSPIVSSSMLPRDIC